MIDPQEATLDQQRGVPPGSSDTIYLTVVDDKGNACSFINSNYMGFGTGIIPGGWGFTLQNRGYNFSFDPEHPNCLEPGKRPYHTIIPSMITRSRGPGTAQDLVASYGVMGGFMQPQGHVQVVCGLIDDRLDPQAVLDRARFCINDGTAGGQVLMEEGIPFQTLSELSRMGHPIQPVTGYRRAFLGRGQIIMKDQQSGVLWGGSDPRADGCAMTQG
jgi:gamma-glutamyltranspeptidase/glutathione hydrolase